MRFRLTPRSMTLDDLDFCKFEFSENFAGFRRYERRQQLNNSDPYCQWQLCDPLNVLFEKTRANASAGLCESNVSVCPSVCHTPVFYQNEESVMISSLSGSHTILVFWCQISSKNSKGVTPSGGVKEGRGGKISSFLSLSVNISKTVAYTATVTIND